MQAYGIASHRHTPEIEQELECLGRSERAVSFTRMLVPLNRGLFTTARPLAVARSTPEL